VQSFYQGLDMEKALQLNRYFLLLPVISGILITARQKTFAQSNEPKSVCGYFLILPDAYPGYQGKAP
jgi:hypothetical protein